MASKNTASQACVMEPDVSIGVKDLGTVVLTDVGDKIAKSGKWPIVMDNVGVVSTFLRHRDVNYIDTLVQGDMQPDRIRMALLGAIKCGKPFVLDFHELDRYDACVDVFDCILPGLMDSILDKSILENDNYKKLVRDSDDKEFTKQNVWYQPDGHFRFVILTSQPAPPEKLVKPKRRMYHINVE